MSDAADLAAELAEAAVAASLSRVSATMPAGVAGECEECGEPMPRLVGGRCGFCRDGRRPPAAAYDAAQRHAPAAPPSSPAKEAVVPAYKDGKYISVPCDGALLKRIELFAGSLEESLAATCATLIADALDAMREEGDAPTATPPPAEWDGSKAGAIVLLENVPNEWLVDEITRRMGDGVPQIEHDAALARAVASEGQLATVREQVRQLLGNIGA